MLIALRHAIRAFGGVICVAVGACAINSDGSITPGFRSSRAWQRLAPPEDVVAYYDAMTLDELCKTWWLGHRSGMLPDPLADKAKLDAFARKGKDLSACAGKYRFFPSP